MSPQNWNGWAARSNDYPRYVPMRDAMRREAARRRLVGWGLAFIVVGVVALMLVPR